MSQIEFDNDKMQADQIKEGEYMYYHEIEKTYETIQYNKQLVKLLKLDGAENE